MRVNGFPSDNSRATLRLFVVSPPDPRAPHSAFLMSPDESQHYHDKGERIAVENVLAVLPRPIFHIDNANACINNITKHVPGCLPADTVQALDKQV
jgi:hypothetical protein